MKSFNYINMMCACIILATHTGANAELFDRGGGMIYDSDQNLTWMKNANVNGKMSVQNATEWVDNLVYGGLDDWRLPTTSQFDDPSCLEDVRASVYKVPLFYEHHVNCLDGEMERLTATADPFSSSIFDNVQNSRYWTSTPYRNEIDPCVVGGYCVLDNDSGMRRGFYWQWDFARSIKTTLRGGNSRFAWAVRDGDVDSITPPPPPTVDPDIAIGQITTKIFVPSFDNGTNNIRVNFVYYDSTPENEDLWELQEIAVNSPAIDDANNGTYISETQIYLPSVIYRRLDANLNIWINLVYYGLGESGEALWKLESYGENL